MVNLELFSWGDTGWGDELVQGIGVTCRLAIFSYLLAMVIGWGGAIASLSHNRIITAIIRLYRLILCSFPDLLVITLIFFGGSQLIRWLLSPFGFEGYIEFDAFLSGVLALGLVTGAYAIDVIRGGIQSVPSGQWEAAQSLGLSKRALFSKVILPQAVRLALPGLDNLWVANIQTTALVSVLGLNDLVRVAGLAGASSRQSTLFYGFVGITYFLLKVISDRGIAYIHRWANRGEATRENRSSPLQKKVTHHA